MDNNYYKSLLENTVECVWVFDLKDNCFKYISPSIFHLRGLTVEEAMQETLEDSLTPESVQKIRNSSLKRYPRFLSGDRSEEIVSDVSEYEQYCKDGSIKVIEISTRLVFNEETQGVDVIGVSRDITKRKQYEKELIDNLRIKTEMLKKNSSTIVGETISSIRIYFFNKFAVFGCNQKEPLNWRTSKTEELFAFFLNGDSRISKDAIIENLWPNICIDKATTYLHTTLYNMKKDLHAIGIAIQIKFSNGYYSYQMPNYYSDLAEFKYIIENTILPFDSVDQKSAIAYEKLISLYQNDFLCQNGYLWSISKSTFIHKQFESVALSLSRYYFLIKNYKAIKRILTKLLVYDNLNETIHELLLKVYLQDNDYSAFLNHYENLEKLLSSELGTKPKKTIQNLYDSFYNIAQYNKNNESAYFKDYLI